MATYTAARNPKYQTECLYCSALIIAGHIDRKFCDGKCNHKYRQENEPEYRLRWKNYKNTQKFIDKKVKERAELRVRVFQHYGMSCACCGESTFEFLTIDHINGGGRKHRKGTGNFYSQLEKEGFPEGLQTLCWNCNCAKGIHGICPHQR